ncbi:hypothetical protein AGMMS49592_1060 [Endomicrobiia bacterium]|nr:hypothetical protein AGMMS49592_1060 [Endomicrobiia bacterium]
MIKLKANVKCICLALSLFKGCSKKNPAVTGRRDVTPDKLVETQKKPDVKKAVATVEMRMQTDKTIKDGYGTITTKSDLKWFEKLMVTRGGWA